MASKVFTPGRASIGFNMTPMIDCTFQLILFFMLTTQMASAEYVDMDVPRPYQSVGQEIQHDGKSLVVLVSVAPYSKREIARDKTGSLKGDVKFFQLRTMSIKPEQQDRLILELKKIRRREAKKREMIVEIRADRRIEYGLVEPVLRAITAAEIGKMRLTVMREKRG